jgi:hypothetical protein
MNSEQTPQPIKYKKPPIIERVVSVVGSVVLDNFYAKFEGWKEIIQPHFPDYDPIKEWKLNLEMKNGVPNLTDAPPEVHVTHRFWRRNQRGERFMSMRILPNQLTLNLHREGDNPHDFRELLAQLKEWLPQWLAHFSVKGCMAVSLDYINVISAFNTPQFINPNGSINVGQALVVFAGVPNPHFGIIQPYDCQMGLMIDPDRPAVFALRVNAGLLPPPFKSGIRIDFHTEVNKNKPTLDVAQVFAEAEFLHTIIIEQFEALFTSTAKKSFEPV